MCVIDSDLSVGVLSVVFFKPCMFTYCFHKGFLLLTVIILREGIIECGINHERQKRSLLFFSGCVCLLKRFLGDHPNQLIWLLWM